MTDTYTNIELTAQIGELRNEVIELRMLCRGMARSLIRGGELDPSYGDNYWGRLSDIIHNPGGEA